MNKKGFTLVELLAVIVILAIVITIALNSMMGVREESMKKALKTKVEGLAKQAVLYAQENQDIFTTGTNCSLYPDYSSKYTFCVVISIGDLVNLNYYETGEVDENGKPTVTNNVTSESMMNDKIIIYRKNNRIYAHMVKTYEYEEDSGTIDATI